MINSVKSPLQNKNTIFNPQNTFRIKNQFFSFITRHFVSNDAQLCILELSTLNSSNNNKYTSTQARTLSNSEISSLTNLLAKHEYPWTDVSPQPPIKQNYPFSLSFCSRHPPLPRSYSDDRVQSSYSPSKILTTCDASNSNSSG